MDELIKRLEDAVFQMERHVHGPGHIAAVKDAAHELKEPHNIPAQLEEIAGRFCDDYCKWPERYDSEGKLYDERCSKCPISLLT